MTEPEKRWVETGPGYVQIENVWTSTDAPDQDRSDVTRYPLPVMPSNPHRWHPSAADHHDRGEECGEVECGRCNP